MEPIIVEIRLSPATEALLKSFVPRNVTENQSFPPQSPAEQATRMRMQQAASAPCPTTPAQYAQPTRPASAPAQAAPAVVPTAPTSRTPAYFTAPGNPPAPTYAPQQYRPQPGPAPTNPIPAPAAGSSTAQPAAYPSNPAPVGAAPAYELDQLARATSTLADAGKMQQIQQLFQQFQIQQLTALPKERYGEYATALRQLGVRI